MLPNEQRKPFCMEGVGVGVGMGEGLVFVVSGWLNVPATCKVCLRDVLPLQGQRWHSLARCQCTMTV